MNFLKFFSGGTLVPGTSKANKAAILGSSKNLDVLGLPVGGLKIGTAGAEVAVAGTAAELNTVAGVTAGTVAASKEVVPDANKDVGSFRNFRTTRVLHAEGAPTSINTAGAATLTAAQLLGGIIVRDPNGAGRTDTLDTAANIVAAIPNAAVGDIFDCLIINGADAAETITLAAGAGGGFDANQTAAARVIPQNASKMIRIRLTNVTASSEAYVIYA